MGYPLQYSSASLMAQLIKNPSVMQETWARPLGGEDPLEKGMATGSSVLADTGTWRATISGITKNQTRLSDFHFHCFILLQNAPA